MQLEGKVVVLTGAAGGVGRAVAKRFAQEGARLVATDLDPHGIEEVTAETGAVGLAADIGTEANVKAVADLARRTYGEVDVWFSNAGIAGPRRRDELQENIVWEKQWAVHVMTHVYAAREVLPSMLERGDGYLLQTASVVAFTAQLDKAPYAVTKRAALALAEWLAATYRPKGIKVSCFCPASMLTPMFLANEFPDDHPAVQAAQTPEEVADRLVRGIDEERFLISDSPMAFEALAARVDDYEGWLDGIGVRSLGRSG